MRRAVPPRQRPGLPRYSAGSPAVPHVAVPRSPHLHHLSPSAWQAKQNVPTCPGMDEAESE